MRKAEQKKTGNPEPRAPLRPSDGFNRKINKLRGDEPSLYKVILEAQSALFGDLESYLLGAIQMRSHSDSETFWVTAKGVIFMITRDSEGLTIDSYVFKNHMC